MLILTTPICCGTIESLLVPSSPTRWHQLAMFPLAQRTNRLAACAHGTDSTYMPTVCFRISSIACELSPVHRQTRAGCAPRGGTGAERKGRMTHLNFSVSHMFNDTCQFMQSPPPPKERGHCVYTLTNRKWCKSLSPGRLRRLLRYRDSGFLFLSFFLSPAFTWTHTDRH